VVLIVTRLATPDVDAMLLKNDWAAAAAAAVDEDDAG
jgi:hypothetical protein